MPTPVIIPEHFCNGITLHFANCKEEDNAVIEFIVNIYGSIECNVMQIINIVHIPGKEEQLSLYIYNL